MHILFQLLSSIVVTLVLYASYLLFNIVQFRINSQIKDVPGPPSKHWFWGNMKEIMDSDAAVLHEKWVEEYGHTLKYKMLFGRERLFTMDTKALNHVLMNHYIYQKPEAARYNLSQILGEGILVTEEDKHKLQRKIMNPAFGPSQIRELTEIFVDKSIELRDVWAARIAAGGGEARIDVLSSLSKMTLDVIGLAGFNYKFNALKDDGGSNELNKAFAVIFGDPEAQKIRPWPLAQTLLPPLRGLPSQDPPGFKEAKKTMSRIGHNLLRDTQASLRDTGGEKSENWDSRDLLSLLVRSNMSGEQGQMSDDDVLAPQVTSISYKKEKNSLFQATTWALFALVQHPDVQHKLREELLYTLSTENPSMDELNSLPYLDKVVRETLRVHAPVPGTMRVAAKDDVIPLGKPLIDRKGVARDSVSVQKGQTIFVPILAINRDKSLWGEDSMEFKPERWDNLPAAVSSIPGVWVEMKALLFILVRNFEFELAVPADDVIAKSTVVQRPRLKSEKDAGSQLPLIVRLHQKA
ncbi:hypothetical protein HHX47_DHR2000902 [Lentinula edodes]|nr:hypothetical protein HHX47_DHR2000902 [Lentinula edodes]